VIEQNESGQLYRYLRSDFELPVAASSLARPGAQQFHPAEILRHVGEWSAP